MRSAIQSEPSFWRMDITSGPYLGRLAPNL